MLYSPKTKTRKVKGAFMVQEEQKRAEVRLIFYEGLETTKAVAYGENYWLRGKNDVASLVSYLGLDSVVMTRCLSDYPLVFEKTYHVYAEPKTAIIRAIEERLDAPFQADLKILNGQMLSKRDQLAMSVRFDDVVFGSSELLWEEGLTRWRKFKDSRSA
jgi:hypothetical protein